MVLEIFLAFLFLPKEVTTTTILASFDVVNLYSNIPHSYGIEAIQYWLEKYPQELPEQTHKNFIIKGIKFILENNYFVFNNEIYRQIKGTAMGTKVAPTYANLVMGYFEMTLYKKIGENFGQFQLNFMQNWKRYLDDCLILWSESEEDLEKFKDIINNIHCDIQFTSESSNKEIPFLDILIKKEGTIIETDIYYKSTDSKQYLLFNSCHPKHVTTNVPYNLAKRICRITSKEETKEKRLEELSQFLTDRLYPSNLIKNGISRAKQERQEISQEPSKTDQRNLIPFVTTYNPRNPDIFPVIQTNLPILGKDKKMGDILANAKIIKSNRQPKNLKQILTKAKFEDDTRDEAPKVLKCKNTKCGICKNIIEGESFTFKNGPTFKVKTNMSCTSKNLLYVMRCEGCGEDYIGQTGNELRKRMTVHRQQIRNPELRMIPLSEHLSKCAKSSSKKFSVFPFLQVSSRSQGTTKDNQRSRIHFKIQTKTEQIANYMYHTCNVK